MPLPPHTKNLRNPEILRICDSEIKLFNENSRHLIIFDPSALKWKTAATILTATAKLFWK